MKKLNFKIYFLIIMILSSSLLLLVACDNNSNVEDYSITYSFPEFELEGSKIVFTRNENINKDADFLPEFPKYIPIGFERSHNIFEHNSIAIGYKNQDDQTLIYGSDLAIDDFIISTPYKNIEIEKINISKRETYFFKLGNRNILMWFDETCVYSLSSDLSREDLIKIAEKNIEQKSNL